MLDRKLAFKLPPTTIRDAALTQEARRCKALEEQKLRRTRKFDSARQLDFFADLTLSDDDDDEEEDESVASVPSIAVGSFVSAMSKDTDRTDSCLETESTTSTTTNTKPTGKKKKRKRGGRKAKKPSKWADKCMYAELLEMIDPGDSSSNGGTDDGLPKDLESGWVAVGPVPVGKRCLAVTHQSSGAAGVAPNTSLRSRLLGKTLIARFPSALPPLTILDCILDVNWKDNGILHVLDVIKWKGQDVGDCEARFRFWWRDTRLAEVAQCMPSITGYHSTVPLPMVSVAAQQTTPTTNLSKFPFTYPTTFLPIPYFTDTSLSSFSEHIIPLAREARNVTINVPVNHSPPSAIINGDADNEGGMDIDVSVLHTANEKHPSRSNLSGHHMLSSAFTPHTTNTATVTRGPAHRTAVVSIQVLAHIESDGLLLYVAEASYESGSSPLSNWIPIVGYERNGRSGDVQRSKNGEGCLLKVAGDNEGPLDLFERLVKRNLERKALLKSEGVMEMDIQDIPALAVGNL